MTFLRQNTAITVVVGPFIDWSDGKTLLRDNDEFTPSDITAELVKGSSSSTLALTKTGGDNNMNLTGKGLATLTLTAANIDTPGQLKLCFVDAVPGGFPTETILPVEEDFIVLPANVYDALFGSGHLVVDINPAMTGITQGGTMTFATAMNILLAFAAGRGRKKAGVSNKTIELLDPEDDETVILTEVLQKISPYRTVTINIG